MAESPKTMTIQVKPDMLAAMESVKELISDHLLRYSEWLDADQHLIIGDDESGDTRTHLDLVQEFLS